MLWKQKKETVAVLFPAAIFAINILIGISFSKYGDFSYIFDGGWQIAKSIVLVTIYTILFSVILYKLYKKIGEIKLRDYNKCSQGVVFGVSFIVLLLCYMPYLYAYYPGSINSDTSHQLASAFGYELNTNHYPFFSTWLMGFCMRVGTAILDNTFGIFIYVLLQTVMQAFAFSNTLRIMVKWKMPVWIVLGAGVYYAVLPIWGGYAQFMIKDTLYSAVVVLFTTMLLELLVENRTSINKCKILGITAVGLVTILLRNNGVYIVLPCLLAGTIFIKRGKKRNLMFIALAVCVVFNWAYGSLVLPAMHIPKGSVREALSVPFQQTARYVKEYEDEVTEEEKAAINAVLAYDWIAENYVDYGADPVKNTYKEYGEDGARLGNYFKYWFLMFFKHPVVYFEATVANSYYYYCANINGSFEPIYLNYIYYDEHTECFDVYQLEEREELRQEIYEYAQGFQELPIIGLLFSQGFYTYVLIGMIGLFCYRKKYKYIIGLLPSALSVLICVASPVNGSYRYFLPVIGCTCICLAYCIKCKELERND